MARSSRYQMPDPNDPDALMARGPMIGPNSGDRLGGALMARGVANRHATNYATSTAARPIGAPAIINTVLPDARWEGLKQALFEAGVGKIRTGAAAGLDQQPGFYDTQTPQMSRAMNTMTPRERLLLQEMQKQAPSVRR